MIRDGAKAYRGILLTPGQVAKYLRVDRQVIVRGIRKHEIPSWRVSYHEYRIPYSALMRWICEQWDGS